MVGIARDGRYQRLSEAPRNFVYLPVLQSYRPDLVLHVATDVESGQVLPAVRAALRSLDPGVPLFDVRTVEEHLEVSTFIPRMAASLLGLFGGVGMLLAAVGLYGVIAFNAAERTREIGLRMALGAARTDVLRLLLRDGLRVAVTGIGVGLMLAAAAGQLVAGQLTGISGADPVSFGVTAGLLTLVASGGLPGAGPEGVLAESAHRPAKGLRSWMWERARLLSFTAGCARTRTNIA